MAIHGMIDLETLSTRPDAVILTLGAVKFNPYTQDDPHDPLYFRIDVDAQTALGRHVMEDTINWWATQPQEIQDEAMGDGDRESLEDTVKKLNPVHGSIGVSEIQEHCSPCTKKQKQSKQMLTMHWLIVIIRQKKCRDTIKN